MNNALMIADIHKIRHENYEKKTDNRLSVFYRRYAFVLYHPLNNCTQWYLPVALSMAKPTPI